MSTGKVLWFDDTMGYGFIKDDEDDAEIYFHWTEIKTKDEYKTVASGTRVTFDRKMIEVAIDEEKPQAFNIKPLRWVNSATGKPIVLIAYIELSGEANIKEIHYRISRFAHFGLTYINKSHNCLIASNQSLAATDTSFIGNIIVSMKHEINENIKKGNKKVIATDKDFRYDIMFI